MVSEASESELPHVGLGDSELTVSRIALRSWRTFERMAFAFTLLHPRTAAVLIAATQERQIDDAIDAIGVAAALTDADRVTLRAVTEVPA